MIINQHLVQYSTRACQHSERSPRRSDRTWLSELLWHRATAVRHIALPRDISTTVLLCNPQGLYVGWEWWRVSPKLFPWDSRWCTCLSKTRENARATVADDPQPRRVRAKCQWASQTSHCFAKIAERSCALHTKTCHVGFIWYLITDYVPQS